MPLAHRLLVSTLLTLLAACNGTGADGRARRAAEQVRQSLAGVDEPALAQKVDPATVRQVQEWLRSVDEYQGTANGELDSVTVNAIQAFQRTAGLDDDGLLDERTLARLQAAAAARGTPPPAS